MGEVRKGQKHFHEGRVKVYRASVGRGSASSATRAQKQYLTRAGFLMEAFTVATGWVVGYLELVICRNRYSRTPLRFPIESESRTILPVGSGVSTRPAAGNSVDQL